MSGARQRFEGDDARLRVQSARAQRELTAVRADIHYRVKAETGEDGVMLGRCSHSAAQEGRAVLGDPQDTQDFGKDVQVGAALR